jgi:hypothetical protein
MVFANHKLPSLQPVAATLIILLEKPTHTFHAGFRIIIISNNYILEISRV